MTVATTTLDLDQQRVDAFTERFVGMMNAGALMLMTSVGHRTGLFDAMATIPPSTSEQIAEVAGLNERYVREWLGAMVTGGFVTYDARTACYALPPEHAACLTRAASPGNLATMAQFIPLLGSVEEKIVRCFQQGGGVRYEDFPCFHRVMADESNQTVCAALVEHILPLVPGLVDRLESGVEAADVGCGSGHAINLLGRIFPNSRFVGYDFSKEAIDVARREAEALGLTNVRFEVQDAATIDQAGRFDVIFAFDAIHDQAKPGVVLERIRRSLKDDGVFLMQDIGGSSHVERNCDHPIAPFMYTVSCMHCMTVSLALDGAGLGAMWGEELALKMLAEAGFGDVTVKRLDHDILNNYYVVQK